MPPHAAKRRLRARLFALLCGLSTILAIVAVAIGLLLLASHSDNPSRITASKAGEHGVPFVLRDDTPPLMRHMAQRLFSPPAKH
ncbi:hypothetical protein [Notoacmeibacter sp. MSK16QG-6]|uniref:hypothetical protein n=1 Tax=Notoacmeibacter sp. MSK16QG-6 TaxID=2957982 RepID=UPI0020A1656E|nr:hypothetical protein [Notoacmeibacter sp. MSK16QG-6]MCP1200620.1 hypothetical protein [Notoacmeibacter sp. MSK16QG-6]